MSDEEQLQQIRQRVAAVRAHLAEPLGHSRLTPHTASALGGYKANAGDVEWLLGALKHMTAERDARIALSRADSKVLISIIDRWMHINPDGPIANMIRAHANGSEESSNG